MKRTIILIILLIWVFVLNARVPFVSDRDGNIDLFNKERKVYISDSLNMHIEDIYAIGMGRDFDIYGDYAYILVGNGLIILDISDSSNPQKVSSLGMNFLNDMECRKIHVYNGEYAYIVSGNAGVWIVDVSSPDNPTVVDRFVVDNVNITDAVYYEGYMYAIGDNGHLYVVDVGFPDSPRIKNDIFCGDINISIVKVIDGYLVVFGGQMYVYDISEVDFPNLVNAFDLVYSCPYSVTALKDTMFICFNDFGGIGEVVLYSFKLPDYFEEVKEWNDHGDDYFYYYKYPMDIYMKDGNLYIGMWESYWLPPMGFLREISFDDFLHDSSDVDTKEKLIGSPYLFPYPVPEKIKEYNGKVYILTNSSFFIDVDVIPDTLQYASFYLLGDIPQVITYCNKEENLRGIFGYNIIGSLEKDNSVGDYKENLNIIKMKNGYIWDGAYYENYGFFISFDTLYVYDFSTDSLILEKGLGEYGVSYHTSCVYYQNNYLYIGTPERVLIFYVYKVDSIEFVNSIGVGGDDIEVKDNYLYVVNEINTGVYDITDINNIIPLSFSDVYGKKMVINDDYMYVCDCEYGKYFNIINISDPSNIYNCGSVDIDTLYIIEDMAIDTLRDYLYVATYEKMYMYDVKDGDNPVLIGYYPLRGTCSVDVSDDGVIWVGGVNSLFALVYGDINTVNNNRNDRENIKVVGLWRNIAFDLRDMYGTVNVKIYDIAGRRVKDVVLNGGGMVNIPVNSGGLYYYVISADNSLIIKGKVVVR